MKINHFSKYVGGLLLAWFCTLGAAHAQQRGGGFGGFGGFGGGGNRGGFGGGSSSSSSSQYNNNGTVGNAVISVDPVTHNIIVIADKETSEQIQRVIESLDEPEPQVLIKVVFLEVQHNNSSDIGVQGSYTGGSWGNALQQISGYVTNFGHQRRGFKCGHDFNFNPGLREESQCGQQLQPTAGLVQRVRQWRHVSGAGQ